MMSINGQEVRPKYDSSERVLAYTPSKPLEAGSYKVSCKVVVDDFLPVTKAWSFSIAPGAITAVPQPNASQVRSVQVLNGIRARIGLPAMEIDPRLCAAALAHTNYLDQNNLTGHYQRPGDPGFIGNTPAQRLDAFGYSDGSWEGVDSGSDTPEQSLRRLFNAPYHRLPFLQPGTMSVGAGFAIDHMTVEFGMSSATGTQVSPAPQERNVPLSWHGPERPDPLAVHGLSGVVGYPIVFARFSPKAEKIVVQKATLTTALGESVPFVMNTPANDEHLDFAAFIIPRKPLKPNTGYQVSVEARTASGKDISTSWLFVTGSR
jgi:uncharacterized protein YkwD